MLLVLCAAVLGCQESPSAATSNLNPLEALRVKRELLQRERERLSPRYRQRLMVHPGRTRAELEAAVAEYVEKTRRLRDAEAARLAREREEAEGSARRSAGAGDTGVDGVLRRGGGNGPRDSGLSGDGGP